MNAGLLRHRVWLQRADTTADGQGGFTVAWRDVCQLWAQIKPSSGNETYRYGQLYPTMTHQVTLRYHPEVHVKDRLAWGTRVFEILSVRNIDERNQILELYCEERVDV